MCVCVFVSWNWTVGICSGAVVNFKLLSKWKIAIVVFSFPWSLNHSHFFNRFFSLIHSLSLLGSAASISNIFIECFSMLLIRFIHCLVIDFRGDVGIQRIKWKIHTSTQNEKERDWMGAINYLQSLDKCRFMYDAKLWHFIRSFTRSFVWDELLTIISAWMRAHGNRERERMLNRRLLIFMHCNLFSPL